jgi:site-specific DNA-methyltransferase (adenine-specific)
MENLLNISQAAKSLGISKETLRRWDKSGKFQSQRHPINNYRVYTIDQVDSFIKEIDPEFGQHNIFSSAISPYSETHLGKLYNVDAVQFLRSINTNSVQLIFADPPYNINKAEWDSFESQKDYVDWSLGWIREAHRVLDSKGSLYICGFSEILADLKWAASPFFKGCKWLVWYYRNKANLGNDWGRSHESILHFRKSKKYIFNVDDVRVPYNSHTLRYPQHPQAETSQYGNGKKYVWTPHPKGAKPKDVFEIPTLSNSSWERGEHPTQKPVELVKKCILASSQTNDLVVDPFGGSGTTFAVAEAFERKWMGSETDENYCKSIVKRLQDKNHLKRIAYGEDAEKGVQRRKKLRG